MRGKNSDEDKRKHLEFIQGVINRLSSNTFLFKGWSITIVVAIFTAMVTTGNRTLLWLCLGVIMIFWCIDAYYLMLEQSYRKLYSEVAKMDAYKIDYSMDIKKFISVSAWFKAFRRPCLLMFYGAMLLAIACSIIFSHYEINVIIEAKE